MKKWILIFALFCLALAPLTATAGKKNGYTTGYFRKDGTYVKPHISGSHSKGLKQLPRRKKHYMK